MISGVGSIMFDEGYITKLKRIDELTDRIKEYEMILIAESYSDDFFDGYIKENIKSLKNVRAKLSFEVMN